MLGKRWVNTLVLLAAGLLAACGRPAPGQAQPTPDEVQTGAPATAAAHATDQAGLVALLSAAGVPVEIHGNAAQPFFGVEGQRLSVAGAEVQLFEFEDPSGAEAAMAGVSPEGQPVGIDPVRWPGTPHFFWSGRVVALYAGDDPAILRLLGAALGAQIAGGPAGQTATREPVLDRLSLVDALRAAGASVGAAGEVTQPFFSVAGQIITVDGDEVQVFEYAAAPAAAAEAQQVAPDGRSAGTTRVAWQATPHFYQSGRVTVFYLGDEARTLSLLEALVGPQFAGGEVAL